MSKRESPPTPFSEATVVQPRNSPPPLPSEAFDARTVVRPSNESAPDRSGFPADMPPPPKAEVSAPASKKEAKAEFKTESKKETKAPPTERAPRAPLDQRSKISIALIAAVAILAGVFTLNRPEDTGAQATEAAAGQSQGTDNLASELPKEASAPKFQQLSGPPETSTAEVLNRFDRASARAQDRAEQYSRSGTGF